MPDASRRTGTYFLKLNGLLLISTCNDYSALTEAPGNDLPYIMNLPTYAADAWYYGLLDETYQNMELEEFLEEVRAFAGGEYQSALFNVSWQEFPNPLRWRDELPFFSKTKRTLVLHPEIWHTDIADKQIQSIVEKC